MIEFTGEQIEKKRGLTHEALNELAQTMMAFLGPLVKEVPAMSSHLYEAMRRLEDVGFRYDSCLQQLMLRTEEGLQQAAQEALDAGRVITGPGEPSDVQGS